MNYSCSISTLHDRCLLCPPSSLHPHPSPFPSFYPGPHQRLPSPLLTFSPALAVCRSPGPTSPRLAPSLVPSQPPLSNPLRFCQCVYQEQMIFPVTRRGHAEVSRAVLLQAVWLRERAPPRIASLLLFSLCLLSITVTAL